MKKGVLQACYFTKKETLAQGFPMNFVKLLRTPFLHKTSGQLLLKIPIIKIRYYLF